jgi:histidinol-phosphate/aromatic aminotransferase/cobyric acid decarboxylase-like protein
MVGALLARGVFVRKPGLPPLDGHIRVTVGTQGERDRLAPIFAEALATLAAPASR